jgi:hypothetical protein
LFEFREDRTTEGSVELCQEGIEKVHRVHRKELCFKFREITEDYVEALPGGH